MNARRLLATLALSRLFVGCETVDAVREKSVGLVTGTLAAAGIAKVESLQLKDDRVHYWQCRRSLINKSCPPDEDTTAFLPKSQFDKLLGAHLEIDAALGRLKDVRADLDLLTLKITAAERRLAEAKRARKEAQEDATPDELQALDDAVSASRQPIETLTQRRKKIAETTLPAEEQAVAELREKLSGIETSLKGGKVFQNPAGTEGAALAFMPFRYTRETCPRGESWKSTLTLGPGKCCAGTRCAVSPVPEPSCELSGGSPAPGGAGYQLNIKLGGGFTSSIKLDGKSYAANGGKASFTVQPRNATMTIQSIRYTADIRGPGGKAACHLDVKVDPECPKLFAWSESRRCCARWMSCTCDELTPEGLRFACDDKRQPHIGDLCFTRGLEEQRLTCSGKEELGMLSDSRP